MVCAAAAAENSPMHSAASQRHWARDPAPDCPLGFFMVRYFATCTPAAYTSACNWGENDTFPKDMTAGYSTMLKFYTRPGCTLCDKAQALLAEGGFGQTFETVNI